MTLTQPTKKDELKLRDLFEHAKSALDGFGSIQDFEPAFIKVLEFILANPCCDTLAEKLFVSEVQKGKYAYKYCEFVEYCMFTLRYPAVLAEAKYQLKLSLKGGLGPPPTNVMVHIIAAYSDDWDGVDAYAYYAK